MKAKNCSKAGCTRPAAEGFSRCEGCREISRRSDRKYRERKAQEQGKPVPKARAKGLLIPRGQLGEVPHVDVDLRKTLCWLWWGLGERRDLG